MIVAKAERFVVRVGLAGDEAAARQVVDYPADSGAAEDDPVAEITHRQPAVGHGLELEQDVVERPDAKVAAVFPPRGRTFTVTQTHWFRMNDAKVAEHWANRDDVGMANNSVEPTNTAVPGPDAAGQPPGPPPLINPVRLPTPNPPPRIANLSGASPARRHAYRVD